MAKRIELEELISFARHEAERLAGRIPGVGAVAPGIEFLRVYAGTDSSFYAATPEIATDATYTLSNAAAEASNSLAELLRQWADYAETGLATAQPFALAARIEAADDLTEQAATLLKDSACPPAVSVMLAGAALEEILRGIHSAKCTETIAKPSIVAYGDSLKKAKVLETGDTKTLIALADTRNDAAHGHFDKISQEGAQIFLGVHHRIVCAL